MTVSPALGRPQRTMLEGRYVRLEPIAPEHATDLWAASSDPGAAERYRYLFSHAPASLAEVEARIHKSLGEDDPLAFAVVDRATGRAGGQQSLMRIVQEHGVIEIGAVYWGPDVARTRLATEALYLFAKHSFEELGYRRFEWKCNNENAPSKRAAERFGFSFEGVFRQHMIIKGENRDTAWFSMLNSEWPLRKAGFLRWLDEANFDAEGNQKTPLSVK